MPCGARDSRRLGHRCESCRKNHIKCNGLRPCITCKRKGVECTSPCVTRSAFSIVQSYQGLEPRTHLLSTDRLQRYSNAFFFALGLSPTLLSVFSVNTITSMIQENKILQDTVSLLGGFYAYQNSTILTLSRHERRNLLIQWHQLQMSVAVGIEGASDGKLDVLLACALLLSFVQILEDLSGRAWSAWICQLHAFISQDENPCGRQTPLLRSMCRLIRILNALRAYCLEQDIDVKLPFRSQELGLRIYHWPSHRQGISACSDDQLLDYFCEDLEMWAKLQWWTTDWKKKTNELDGQQDLVNRPTQGKSLSYHEYRGVELTCIASQFQRDIITSLLWYTNRNSGSLTNVMLAFYHCANVDISHMFCDPVWLSLNCELPVMAHEMSYEQATSALRYAENGLQHSYLEAIFYGPILYTVSMTMRYKSERSRILDFVSKLKQKGFLIADQFLSAIEQAWTVN